MHACKVILTLTVALTAISALAQPPTHECDRVAGEPGVLADAPGVAFDAIDAPAALTACAAALQQHPSEARFLHAYGRALQRAGQSEAAARLYGWAANEGYAPAQYALGQMLRRGDGVPLDAAAAERWLALAAAQGYVPPAGAFEDDPADAPPVTPTDELLALEAAASTLALPVGERRAAAGATLLPATTFEAEALDPFSIAERLTASAAALDPADYSLDALAQTIGADAVAAFEYVRDRVRFEAYAGVLRGPDGTLLAKAGNAYDRSLLLAALLERIGVPARFAFGRLDETAAATLYDAMFRAEPPTAGAAGATEFATPRFIERLLARAARDYGLVRAALGDLLARIEPPSRAALLAEIRPHVWVEAQIDGEWVALDSAFPNATPGERFAAVESTATTMPEQFDQALTLRVVTETAASAQSTPLLEARFRAAELAGAQLFLLFQPLDGLTQTGEAAGGAVGGVLDLFGSEAQPSPTRRFVPLLFVDGAPRGGQPLVLDDSLAAVWLEVEVALPDGTREASRRALLDRVGSAARAAGLRPTAFEPWDADAAPLELLTVHNVRVTTGPQNLLELAGANALLTEVFAKELTDETTAATIDIGRALWMLGLGNALLPMVSDHVIVPALNDRPDVRFYAATPRVFIVSHGPAPETEGVLRWIDLHRDAIRGAVRDDAARARYAERQLWFGLLEGALETELSRDTLSGIGVELVSTSELGGEGVVAFGPDQAGALSAVDNAALAALLAERLGAGAMTVVPRASLAGGPAAWWEIAPDGATRAVLDVGTGATGGLYGRSSYSRGLPGSFRNQVWRRGRGLQGNPWPRPRPAPVGGGGSVGRPGGRMGPPGRAAGGSSLGEYATVLTTVTLPAWISYPVLELEVAIVVFKIVGVLYE